jgi:hypothetical protein
MLPGKHEGNATIGQGALALAELHVIEDRNGDAVSRSA